MYNGHIHNAKGGRMEGGRWGWMGCGGEEMGRENFQDCRDLGPYKALSYLHVTVVG